MYNKVDNFSSVQRYHRCSLNPLCNPGINPKAFSSLNCCSIEKLIVHHIWKRSAGIQFHKLLFEGRRSYSSFASARSTPNPVQQIFSKKKLKIWTNDALDLLVLTYLCKLCKISHFLNLWDIWKKSNCTKYLTLNRLNWLNLLKWLNLHNIVVVTTMTW